MNEIQNLKEYKPRQKTCNVLMRDYRGWHRLNNDFLWSDTPMKIAKKYGFDFAPGSVKINAVAIDDGMLNLPLLSFFGIDEILLTFRRTARLLIMGNDLSQFKKPKEKPETVQTERADGSIVEESEDEIE